MTSTYLVCRSGRILALLLAAAGLMAIGGCESDSVAPQDPDPALSEADVAQQSAVVAAAMSRLAPEIVDFIPPKAKEPGVYPYEFPAGGNVAGSVTLEFFTGGAGGAHASYDVADYGMLYTAPGEVLNIEIPLGMDFSALFDVALDLAGPIDQAAGTAVVSGGGTFYSGPWTSDFTFTGLEVARTGDHPREGTLTFVSGAVELVVVFDGDETATILLDDNPIWEVDLETGVLTLLD